MGILENTYTLTILSALVYLKHFMQRRVILEHGRSGLTRLNFGCWEGRFLWYWAADKRFGCAHTSLPDKRPGCRMLRWLPFSWS